MTISLMTGQLSLIALCAMTVNAGLQHMCHAVECSQRVCVSWVYVAAAIVSVATMLLHWDKT